VTTNLYKSLLISISLLMVAGSASAQTGATIRVGPEVFYESLSRNEVWESKIQVGNPTGNALPVRLSLVRWDASDEEGGVVFSEAEAEEKEVVPPAGGATSIGPIGVNQRIDQRESAVSESDASFDATHWFALSEQDMILAPGEVREIPFTVTVPGDAEPGGKYVALWIDPQLPEFYFNEQPVRVIPRVSVLFLLDIPIFGVDGEGGGEIAVEEFAVENRSPVLSGVASRIASLFRAPLSAFAADPAVSVDVLDGSPGELLLRVQNTRSTHVRPEATLTIRNALGGEVATLAQGPTTVLPGKIRQIPLTIEGRDLPLLPRAIERQLAFGRYSAQAVLTVPGSDPILTSLTYWVFPWQSLLLGLFSFGGGGLVMFKFRHRFAVAFRVLFRGRAGGAGL